MRDERKQLVHCGRTIGPEEVEAIRETVSACSGLSRFELAFTICEHLDWRTASGSLKRDACLKLLEKLEHQGLLRLPQKRSIAPGAGLKKRPKPTRRTEAAAAVEGSVAEMGPVRLAAAAGEDETDLWNEYVSRYHYLGYAPPIGCFQRYFIESERGILGCLLFSGAAKSLRERDRWIGWSKDERLRNLGFVINNSRFLVFPWVRVKNLASHALGQAARRIGDDWQKRWGYRPLLLETFVDPELYEGTCYLAANWRYLGMTTGQGLARRGKSYTTTPKKIFVKPVADDFRTALCS
ncbi:MAG TPA: DUF4338 domain-containing protein [Gammaproteobacteria bacterium]|nr:DUF4338 domain-containing protein [Gammaproteobacteria bacterium]